MRIIGTLRDSLGQPCTGAVRCVLTPLPRLLDSLVALSDPVTASVSAGALDVTLLAGAYAMFTCSPTQPIRLHLAQGSGTADLAQNADNFANLTTGVVGLPPGGTTDQGLSKNSATGYVTLHGRRPLAAEVVAAELPRMDLQAGPEEMGRMAQC